MSLATDSKGMSLNLLRVMIEQVKINQGLTKDELLELFNEQEDMIPINIFCTKLAPLESIVAYLNQNKKMSYSQIAVKLNRQTSSIWKTHNDAMKKQDYKKAIELIMCANNISNSLDVLDGFDNPSSSGISREKIKIDVKRFANRNFAILEHLVLFLKDETKMPMQKIAVELNRNIASLWATYYHAKKKINLGRTAQIKMTKK